MGHRHDIYIDYNRSNKKRGKKRNWKPWLLSWVVILVGIGFASYYFLFSGNHSNDKKSFQNKNNVTVIPTAPPTIQPAKDVVADDVQNEVDVKAPIKPQIARGIYVPSSVAGSNELTDLMRLADSTEINAMVIDVKNDDGKISYAMEYDMAKTIGAVTSTISDMEGLVKALKEKNIYLIARIVAFKDPLLAEKRPDLAIKNQNGTIFRDKNGQGWVNPYNKKVWNYLIGISSQAAAIGFDEIQFDYIRFSTDKMIQDADLGESAEYKSKENIITEFTKYAYHCLKPLGVNVSADVYGTIIASSVDAGIVGQNYVEMSKYLDYICPMIYPSHFAEGNFGVKYPDLEPFQIISKVLSISAKKLKEIPEGEHRAIVRPWLQDFTASWIEPHLDYGAKEIREQIEAVYSVGYDEWLLWNSGCDYTANGLLEE